MLCYLEVMATSATVPPSEPASVYSSSVCSEETTDEPHFIRLNVPTETDTSDNDRIRTFNIRGGNNNSSNNSNNEIVTLMVHQEENDESNSGNIQDEDGMMSA
ncbi:hypothetical protein BGX24_006283, partial [Mortierella sp. AD032]